MPTSGNDSISGIEFLSSLLAKLQHSFDATVLDVRDEMDGSIVVDVRLDANRALAMFRRRVRALTADEVAKSASLLEQATELQLRSEVLMDALRRSTSTTMAALDENKSGIAAIRLLRSDTRTVLQETATSSRLGRAAMAD